MAVSIPIFTAQLRKARVATDLANERAGKAAAVSAALTAESDSDKAATKHEYYYDAAKGVVATNNTGISAYGKVSDAVLNDGFADGPKTGTKDHTKCIVKVTIETTNEVTVEWVEAAKETATNPQASA